MGAGRNDSQLTNYLVRMVVPMRREFGRNLNVGQFLHDFSYAREVLDEALRSQDTRLLEYARYVERHLHGARVDEGSAGSAPATVAGADVQLPAGSATPAVGPTEEDLTARVLKKYTSGLR